MEPWEQMLDEFALHPDPMPWYRVVGFKFGIADQHAAVMFLLERELVKEAGIIREQWKDTLYCITPLGQKFWADNLQGKRVRPRLLTDIPRFSVARYAVLHGPREVFDLADMPWRWSMKREQMSEFGEAQEDKHRYRRPRWQRKTTPVEVPLVRWGPEGGKK